MPKATRVLSTHRTAASEMAIVKVAPDYTHGDLVSDLQHLLDLADVAVDSLVEIDRANLDCAEQNELNRATSLAWITRDQIDLIKERASQENDARAAASS